MTQHATQEKYWFLKIRTNITHKWNKVGWKPDKNGKRQEYIQEIVDQYQMEGKYLCKEDGMEMTTEVNRNGNIDGEGEGTHTRQFFFKIS